MQDGSQNMEIINEAKQEFVSLSWERNNICQQEWVVYNAYNPIIILRQTFMNKERKNKKKRIVNSVFILYVENSFSNI